MQFIFTVPISTDCIHGKFSTASLVLFFILVLILQHNSNASKHTANSTPLAGSQ